MGVTLSGVRLPAMTGVTAHTANFKLIDCKGTATLGGGTKEADVEVKDCSGTLTLDFTGSAEEHTHLYMTCADNTGKITLTGTSYDLNYFRATGCTGGIDFGVAAPNLGQNVSGGSSQGEIQFANCSGGITVKTDQLPAGPLYPGTEVLATLVKFKECSGAIGLTGSTSVAAEFTDCSDYTPQFEAAAVKTLTMQPFGGELDLSTSTSLGSLTLEGSGAVSIVGNAELPLIYLQCTAKTETETEDGPPTDNTLSIERLPALKEAWLKDFYSVRVSGSTGWIRANNARELALSDCTGLDGFSVEPGLIRIDVENCNPFHTVNMQGALINAAIPDWLKNSIAQARKVGGSVQFDWKYEYVYLKEPYTRPGMELYTYVKYILDTTRDYGFWIPTKYNEYTGEVEYYAEPGTGNGTDDDTPPSNQWHALATAIQSAEYQSRWILEDK